MGFERLYKNLIDIIKEEQAKLGFRREAIRLYYPLSSLNHFFETEYSEEEMLNKLQELPDFIKETLGDIKVTSKKERFCFHIPEEGSSYVHDNTKPNEFIKELVELVGQHGCKIEDIIALFKEHNKDIVVEEINNGEFDYLIRFPKENEIHIIIVSTMKDGISSIIAFYQQIMKILIFKTVFLQSQTKR